MIATVGRNGGEFSCVVNGKVLLKAKIASGIARVHDMVDAINLGAIPEIHSEGRGDKRRFTVTLGEFVFVSGMSAHGGYKALDRLEEALAPQAEMPAVPAPDMTLPHFETIDGSGGEMQQ